MQRALGTGNLARVIAAATELPRVGPRDKGSASQIHRSPRIVFAAPPGHRLTDPQYNNLVVPTVKLVERVPQTVGVSGTNLKSPLTLSKDRAIGFADIDFAVSVDKLSQQTKDALERVAGPARKAGLGVEFSGGVISTSSSGGGSSDVIGLLIAFVVLYFMFGALLVAGLPLISALTGVAIGLLGLTALTGVLTLNSTTPTLALMLGLAVGIDYALFIVSRHRQHLDEGMSVEQSVALSVATAGSAVCFAGLTVVIALAGLLVVGIPFLSTMGLGAAGTVVLAVLIANTMLPALLGFAGIASGDVEFSRLASRGAISPRGGEPVVVAVSCSFTGAGVRCHRLGADRLRGRHRAVCAGRSGWRVAASPGLGQCDPARARETQAEGYDTTAMGLGDHVWGSAGRDEYRLLCRD
jgi:uncharacterized membrane protein YdfJ with MMPL/SSD domain